MRTPARLLCLALTIATVPVIPAPGASAAAPAGRSAAVCEHRTGVSHEGGIYDKTFTEDSVCGNKAASPVYKQAAVGSGQVGVLDTTESWFLCWVRGERHDGGNDVWYYTQGDRVVNDPSRRAYGYVPASYLSTENDPADSKLEECPKVATNMTSAYMVYDRTTGKTLRRDEHKQFRSASLVKILIALDYLETRGPGAGIPPADRALLEPMLRASHDDAASTLWTRGGSTKIVERMVKKIGLADTAPPERPGMWGYTALSAADMVTVYRYLLEKAHPEFRDFIMGNLRQATKCAADGWDQYFGIPRAVPRPWAIKQGWSGYPATPPPGQECRPDARTPSPGSPAPDTTGPGKASTAKAGPDLNRHAMHTSGTVCAADRKIMVVLSLHPVGTSWTDSATRLTALTALTKSLHTQTPCTG